MNSLLKLRKEKDYYFAHDHNSPLTAEQKTTFTGLEYFPENPSLQLEVEVVEFLEKEPIEMQTTTGDIQVYQRYGRFRFYVDEQEAELTLYLGEHGYFLPFVDSLAGKETYPAGRYLVDFNLAYNPYCAYNDYWSCPLTPFENRLKVPVRAGEKIYHA